MKRDARTGLQNIVEEERVDLQDAISKAGMFVQKLG